MVNLYYQRFKSEAFLKRTMEHSFRAQENKQLESAEIGKEAIEEKHKTHPKPVQSDAVFYIPPYRMLTGLLGCRYN